MELPEILTRRDAAPRVFRLVAMLALLSACGGKAPVAPDLPSGPTVTCPANIEVMPAAAPVAVPFASPVASNGSDPVAVSCSPAAGSSFGSGQSLVTCSAQDRVGRTSSCTFVVTVTPVPPIPRLQVSRFMAFGDSITAGEISFNLQLILDPTRSYPTELGRLLSMRYTAQSFDVINEGQSGERAQDGAGRISGALERNQPEVLLLLQGIVDVSDFRTAGIDRMIDGLKYDIRDAQRRNVKVLLSTLLPEKPGFRATAIDLVEDANDRIRDLASRENVPLVDSWQAFRGREATLIGVDGLHPTVEGYFVLAQTFFDRIRATFEVSASAMRR